ncbi:hypothetical protein CDL12_02028 [Handroanthus impetiginosus]|uniref:Remorin C-terminal domain-containing protein n=1 Tax=Handroanthus impetiginosus TaxID=429701 RepID=A0A2G9I631_9LAMI|nr:hypothetical protein CDL12_02028 [Handroanthus impetiginosus]
MRKNSTSIRYSGAYTSPGTPEYGDNNVGEMPKPWSSERVPSTSSSRRHISAAALMPFNSGRALPSKWDDAERWITSPISAHSSGNGLISQPQRRPKSKSGPLGPPGLVYLPSYSPIVPALEGGNVRNFVANSPLTTGVLVPDVLSIRYDALKSNSLQGETTIARGTSAPALADLVGETSMPSSQDDKLDGSKEEESEGAQVVGCRDMATQMSPEGSTHSSSKGRLSFSTLSFTVPTSLRGNVVAKDEVRDVQVDKGTTTARKSKKQGLKKMDLTNVEDVPVPWNASEESKRTSKLQREEAKITAWENLQKAKAEAAIQKLEMKLEKKRSASMDKIMEKLRTAQMKAQAMRNSLSEDHAPEASRNSRKGLSFCIYVKAYLPSECFFFCRRKS